MNKQQSHCFLMNRDTYEVIGPVTYYYTPGTSCIIDYNRLAHEQFTELSSSHVAIPSCDLLTTTIYVKGSALFSAIRTSFYGNQDGRKGFVTKLDKRENDGQMTFSTFYSPTYSEAVKQHIELVQNTAL